MSEPPFSVSERIVRATRSSVLQRGGFEIQSSKIKRNQRDLEDVVRGYQTAAWNEPDFSAGLSGGTFSSIRHHCECRHAGFGATPTVVCSEVRKASMERSARADKVIELLQRRTSTRRWIGSKRLSMVSNGFQALGPQTFYGMANSRLQSVTACHTLIA